MIAFPSQPTFRVLAALYDHGVEEVSGVELSRRYPNGFTELLNSRILSPVGLAREIEAEDRKGRTYLAPTRREQDGGYSYLCRYRGWVRLDVNVCKRYRLLREPMPGIIDRAAGLQGHCRRVDDGLVYWGTCPLNGQQVEVYWSRPLCCQQSDSVRAYMNGRCIRWPAVVLQTNHLPPRHDLGKSVVSLNHDALWNSEGQFDRWQFHRAIAEHSGQKLSFGEEFLWYPESGTFLFPDQRAVTFKGASGKMLVDYLVECYRQGKPWVDQEYLTQIVLKVKSRRVQDVVKSVPDWKSVITVKGTRCRLNV